jgi:hypothetical protein
MYQAKTGELDDVEAQLAALMDVAVDGFRTLSEDVFEETTRRDEDLMPVADLDDSFTDGTISAAGYPAGCRACKKGILTAGRQVCVTILWADYPIVLP